MKGFESIISASIRVKQGPCYEVRLQGLAPAAGGAKERQLRVFRWVRKQQTGSFCRDTKVFQHYMPPLITPGEESQAERS